MRSIGLAVAVVLLAGAVVPTQAAAAGPLDGNWNIAHRAYTPSSDRDPVAQFIMNMGNGIQIQNNQVTPNNGNNWGFTVAVVFDPSNPRNVDFSMNNRRLVLHAIYRIDGNVLTIAMSFDRRRPTTFDDTVNNLVIILAH